MATITSNGTGGGNWTAGATWAGGVKPANGDAVVIAASDVIVYDEDMSGWANGIAGMTIQSGATLIASTTAGSYYLKSAGHIQNSGTIQAGTSASVRYPSNCRFKIYMNGNYQISNQSSHAGKIYMYCYKPANPYAVLLDSAATSKPISNITMGSTTSVYCPAHGLSAGNIIYLYGMTGADELNWNRFRVSSVTDLDNFVLRWYDTATQVDSSKVVPYVSGGYVVAEIAAAASATTLYVDRDLTGCPEWTVSGARVMVCNNNRSAQSELNTVASITSSTVVLSTPLAAEKVGCSVIVLIDRNVTIEGSTSSSNGLIRYGDGCVFDCAIRAGASGQYGTYQSINFTMGGVVSGAGYSLGAATGSSCEGTVVSASAGFFNGNHNVFTGNCFASSQLNYAETVTEFSGLAVGCGYSVTNSYGCRITKDARVIGSGVGASVVGGLIVEDGALFINNLYGLLKADGVVSGVRCYGNYFDSAYNHTTYHNSIFSAATENLGYSSYYDKRNYQESYDHDQVAGAFRSWTRGGITSSNTSEKPTGRTRSYQSVCESATYPCWHQREILVEAGRTVFVRVWGKADSGTTFYSQLVLPTADPLITGTGTGEWQQTIPADGTWREYVTSWTNSATYPVTIYLRFLGYGVTKNAYSDFEWTFDQPTMYVRW